MENLTVFTEDDYKVFDRLADEQDMQPTSPGPIGWVRVYFDSMVKKGQFVDGDLHHEGHNLVVAQGRQYVAQKLFTFATPPTPDWTAYSVTHFAIGGGGATVVDDVVTLQGPLICNTELIKPITLSGSYLTEPGGYSGTAPYGSTGAVKPITTDGSIVMEDEDYTNSSGGGTCSYKTKVKCTCVIPSGEPVGLVGDNSVQISEAGLYFVSGTIPELFSHICFAPKWKENLSTLTVVWYILC